MIYFVLNNLRRPAGVGLDAGLEFRGLELYLDGFIAFARPRTAEKGQTAFLGVVRAVLLDDLGIEHNRIRRSSSALVKKGDDALLYADHIRRHADTSLLVRHQRVKQVLRDLQIFFRCDLRPSRKEYRIVHQFFNHITPTNWNLIVYLNAFISRYF